MKRGWLTVIAVISTVKLYKSLSHNFKTGGMHPRQQQTGGWTHIYSETNWNPDGNFSNERLTQTQHTPHHMTGPHLQTETKELWGIEVPCRMDCWWNHTVPNWKNKPKLVLFSHQLSYRISKTNGVLYSLLVIPAGEVQDMGGMWVTDMHHHHVHHQQIHQTGPKTWKFCSKRLLSAHTNDSL